MKIGFVSLALAGTALAGTGTYLASRSTDHTSDVRVVDGASRTSTSSGASTSSLAAAQASDAAAATTCMSKSSRLPWGNLGYRTWTPTNTSANAGTPAGAGIATGQPFSARLIQAYGFDTEFSRRSAILETSDGCRRQYQTASFNSGDLSYISSQITQHPYATDGNSYTAAPEDEGQVTQTQINNGQVKSYQTKHFNLLYGVATDNVSYTYQAGRGGTWQDFLVAAGKTLEDGWNIDRYVLEAPMPYMNASTRKKVNVYICGTGLPFIANGDNEDCGASAAKAIYASSVYLQPGSTSLWHEYGHSIQFYSGGFRDRGSAGPIWETNANFVAFSSSPHYDAGVGYYYSNLENGPFWSNSRYGAWPVMSYLFEKDATRKYVYATWTNNLRDANGASQEDFVQSLVRLAQADGVYASGYQSFADDMGWYAARLTTGDMFNQRALLDLRNTGAVAKLYAPLATTGSAGTYTSPTARPLIQWGTHIVPLTTNGSTLTATVTGTTAANSAAWRYVIVSLAANGTPRYSTLGKATGTTTGTAVSLAAVSGEKAYLVVTATPYAYQSLGWQPTGATYGYKFPYRVAIGGATPLTGSTTACNSVPSGQQGYDLNWNTNGNTDQPVACS